MASTRLQRTVSSTTNTNIWTYSAWFKRGNLNINDALLLGTFSTDFELIRINSSNQLYYLLAVGGTGYSKITSQVFRDTSAWYHLVISRNGSTVNIYVNGELVTDYATNNTFPTTGYFNTASRTVTVGGRSDNTNYFDGEMAHVHFIDGTVYDADTFGETDATTGIWKPKTAPSVTYGTNGFFLKFENSGAFGTDSSGNGNNFTVNGTMTQTIDTPSNVFATINGVNKGSYFAGTLSNGNLSHTGITAGNYYTPGSTLRVSSGKYYAEFKCQSTTNWTYVGVDTRNLTATNDWIGKTASGWSYLGGSDAGGSNSLSHNNTLTSYGDSYTTNDIIGIALDLDNKKLYFHKNGTYQNSGVPTSGATGTGAIDISTIGDDVYFGASNWSGTFTSGWDYNFGNGYFGTTQVSSAQNPDDGIGIFEYSPPVGYKSLCTKSLNSQEYD